MRHICRAYIFVSLFNNTSTEEIFKGCSHLSSSNSPYSRGGRKETICIRRVEVALFASGPLRLGLEILADALDFQKVCPLLALSPQLCELWSGSGEARPLSASPAGLCGRPFFPKKKTLASERHSA